MRLHAYAYNPSLNFPNPYVDLNKVQEPKSSPMNFHNPSFLQSSHMFTQQPQQLPELHEPQLSNYNSYPKSMAYSNNLLPHPDAAYADSYYTSFMSSQGSI